MKKPCGVFVITYGNDSNPEASGFGTLRSVQRAWEHLAQFGNMNAYTMQIFDRWGRELFASQNIARGWDGRERGTDKELPIGVYVYLITYEDFRGRTQQMGGKVTLIR